MIFLLDPHDLVHCISLKYTLIGHHCHHHLNIKLHLSAIGLAGPAGFDPTTTGSGGLRFFSKGTAPCPDWATGPVWVLNLLIYETYRPQITHYSLNSFLAALAHEVYYSWL